MLDAEAERLGEAEVQAFETEGLIGTSAAPAVLAYLFHRIEGRLDGRPTLLIVDEGWLALDDEGFAGQLREWLKTLRKKNASVIFATQSLSDIDGSAIAPAIIESCPTRLFLPNERAIEPQITAIYRRFGLNDRQIEILARATPKRDYYCQSRRGNRLFELGLGRRRTCLYRCVLEVGPGRHQADPRRAWPRGFCSRMAEAPRPGVGRRHHPRSFCREREVMTAIRHLAAVGAVALTVSFTTPPSSAQVIVFDPNNYAQNVLTAARALQQINNQITSLQNQAQMLINQAKNLANLPFSSLQQLQSSIQRTQQLLNQAQRIAYDIGADRSRLLDHLRPGLGRYIEPGTDIQRANALADLGCGVAGCVAGAGRRRRQSRHQPHANVGACDIEPVRHRSLAGSASRQSARRSAGPATRRSDRCGRGARTRSEPGSSPTHIRAGPGQGAAPAFPDAGLSVTNPQPFRCFIDELLSHFSTIRAGRGRGVRRARRQR